MSRKGDIAEARKIWDAADWWFSVDEVLHIAYDLGRASQAEDDLRYAKTQVEIARLAGIAKRLRAKVRKAAGDTK